MYIVSICSRLSRIWEGTLGIKIGSNYSVLNSELFNSTPKIGYSFGAGIDYEFDDKFSVFYEVGYADIGMKIAAKEEGNDEYEFYKFNIISVNSSLLINYYINNPELSVQIGPSYTISNQPRIKDEIRYYNYESKTNTDIGDDSAEYTLESLEHVFSGVKDLSLVIGVTTGIDNARLSLRYYKGVTSFFNGTIPLEAEIKRNYLEMSGLFFF